MITVHKIGSFIPFNHKAFFCPICGSNEFYELYPYGGVWCGRCNAEFHVSSTCDGISKVAIHVNSKNVWWQNVPEDLYSLKMATHFWAVMWETDDVCSWMARLQSGKLATIEKTSEGKLRVFKQ